MKRSYKKNGNGMKKVNKLKITILFIAIALFVVVGGAVITYKFSINKQVVQADDNNTEEGQDEASSQYDSNNEETDNSVNKESNSSAENVAYLEKYIEQQEKNQMPDGADGKKVAYITFDDGPSKTVTPQILDILKAENVHATFFLIGRYVDSDDASKKLVKREIEEGNAIGIHSYSHNYHYLCPNNKISVENCMSDFDKTDKAIKNVLGQNFSTRAIRFPGGQDSWSKNDPEGAEKVDKALHEKGWYQIDWNAESGDAEGGHKDAVQLTQEAIKTIGKREKALILMHDTYGKEETAKALPGIIEYLKQQGYEFKTIE